MRGVILQLCWRCLVALGQTVRRECRSGRRNDSCGLRIVLAEIVKQLDEVGVESLGSEMDPMDGFIQLPDGLFVGHVMGKDENESALMVYRRYAGFEVFERRLAVGYDCAGMLLLFSSMESVSQQQELYV